MLCKGSDECSGAMLLSFSVNLLLYNMSLIQINTNYKNTGNNKGIFVNQFISIKNSNYKVWYSFQIFNKFNYDNLEQLITQLTAV